MSFSKAVVKHRRLILIIALVLMIPSVLGMAGTRINYDMLDYLPEDMETVIGQNELLEDFGKGAFSFIIVEDMPAKDVAAMKAKIERVDHVETVLWYDTVADLSVPMELLPDRIYKEFNTENATMMAVFFDTSTSSDITMDALRDNAAASRQLACAVCISCKYRHDDTSKSRNQLFYGRDIVYYKGALGRTAACRHNGLFHIPVAQLQ